MDTGFPCIIFMIGAVLKDTIKDTLLTTKGTALWLRRCATSWTVPGSIPGGVTGFFSDIFPSDHTMALGLTQLLVKMSRACAEPDDTCAETRFRLSTKRTSPFESEG